MNHNLQNLGMQFIWWVGVIEDRQDPQKAGRYRVRIIGAHTPNKSDLPTSQLPWAQPLLASSDATPQLKEGDYVVGFYFDGVDSQVPVIMGALPGVPTERRPSTTGFSDPRTAGELQSSPKHPSSVTVANGPATITEGNGQRNPQHLNESTLSRIARNEHISETAINLKRTSVTTAVPTAGGGTWSEPQTKYAASYPYNRVMETESGHVLEFDDTPGAERVHIYHRSGSFIEIHPDGTMVTRVHNSDYEVVLADKKIYVRGDVDITATGDIKMKAGGNIKMEAGGDIDLNATGQMKTYGAIQEHSSLGPMNLNGIPMNLNGPVVPVPVPVLPITTITAGSSEV